LGEVDLSLFNPYHIVEREGVVMPYFAGGVNPEEIIKKDVEDLAKLFEPWREMVDTNWDPMMFIEEDTRENLIAARHPTVTRSKITQTRQEESQFRTAFVPIRHEILVNRLDRAVPHIEVAILNQERAALDQQAALERWAMGILNTVDHEHARLGTGLSWRRELYANASYPGKIAGLVHVRRERPDSDEATVDWKLFDPYNCYHDLRGDPKRFVYEDVKSGSSFLYDMETIKMDTTAEYVFGPVIPSTMDPLSPPDNVTVADYWVEERYPEGLVVWNALLCDGELCFLRKLPFKHLPIFVVSLNTLGRTFRRPRGPDENRKANPERWIINHARPWFADLERHIRQLNTVRSMELDAIDLLIHPPLITRPSEGQSFVIEDSRLASQQIPLEAGQFIDFLSIQSQAVTANATIVEAIERELEAKYPVSLLGQISAPGESGYLFNLRTDAAKNAILQVGEGAALFLQRGLQEAAFQFMDAKLRMTLRTQDPNGQFRYESFKASDMPKSWNLNVRLAPQLPEDDMRAAQIFTTVTERGGMSKLTARAHILGIRDPVAEEDRIREERIRDHPVFVNTDLLATMEAEIERLDAEVSRTTDQDKRTAAIFRLELAKAKYDSAAAELLRGVSQFQQPAAPQGIAPSEQPPEERGAMSPDVQAAIMAGGSPLGGTPSPNGAGGL